MGIGCHELKCCCTTIEVLFQKCKLFMVIIWNYHLILKFRAEFMFIMERPQMDVFIFKDIDVVLVRHTSELNDKIRTVKEYYRQSYTDIRLHLLSNFLHFGKNLHVYSAKGFLWWFLFGFIAFRSISLCLDIVYFSITLKHEYNEMP